MSHGIFTDRNRRPSTAELCTALGKSRAIWESLIQSVRRQYDVREDFSFLYGKNYGWAVRFRFKGKLLVCFYPNSDYVVTQIIMNTRNLSDPFITSLHQHAKKAIESATPYPEGKWLFITTKTRRDANDIRLLLNLKVKETNMR